MPAKLYGVAPSQPTRAVLFLCAIKGYPIKLVKVSPAAPRSKRKDYIENINPTGKVPALEGNNNIYNTYLY